MKPTISSLEDKSSILYEGRAKLSAITDIAAMENHSWKQRLADAIEKSGRSKREISLSANMGAGYVHSILAEGKDPTVDNLLKICEALNVSVTSILYGFEISPETEEILSLVEKNPKRRRGILDILKNEDTP